MTRGITPPSDEEPTLDSLHDDDREDLGRVGRGVWMLLGGSGFGRFLGLVFNFLAARLGGEHLFGLYTLAQTVVNYAVTCAAMGLNDALVRFISIYRGLKDRSRVVGVLIQGLRAQLILSLLAAGLVFALAPELARIVFHKPGLTVYLRFLAPTIPALCLVNLFMAATQGYRKMHYTPLVRDLVLPISKIALTAVVFLLAGPLMAVLIGSLGAALLAAVAAAVILVRLFGPMAREKKPVGEKNLWRFSLPLFLNDLVQKTSRWSDVIFLGFFSGAGHIGIYRSAQITSEVSRIIWQAFKTTFSPSIADLHHRGEAEQLRRQYQTVSRWAFAVSFPPLVFFTFLAREMLTLFGPQFATGAPALVILNAGRILAVGTGVSANMIVMSGRSRLTLGNSLFGHFLNFSLNFLLISRFDMYGAAWAFALSTGILNLLQMGQVRWLFGYWPYTTAFLKPLFAALLAGVAAKGLALAVPLPPWAELAICAPLFLVLYLGTLLLLRLPPEDRLLIRQLGARFRRA